MVGTGIIVANRLWRMAAKKNCTSVVNLWKDSPRRIGADLHMLRRNGIGKR